MSGILTGYAHVYANGGEIVGRVTCKKAVMMIHRGVAVPRDVVEGVKVGPYPLPSSLNLIRQIDWVVYRKTGSVPYSRNALFIRDRGRCLYCNKPGNTMDHIMPKSRGGKSEWLNAATACLSCNNKKADRTPEEAGMPLLRAPYAPTFLDIYDPRV